MILLTLTSSHPSLPIRSRHSESMVGGYVSRPICSVHLLPFLKLAKKAYSPLLSHLEFILSPSHSIVWRFWYFQFFYALYSLVKLAHSLRLFPDTR